MPTPSTPTPEPSPRDRRLLNLWGIATFFPAIGILVYWPASTRPGLESFSEEPHGFTLFLSLCLACSVYVLFKAKPPAFDPFLTRRMRLGTATAALFFLGYTTYIYSFSRLPPAPNAPLVGDKAPDFSITDPEGRNWTLSEMKGDTLVFFYRGHW